MSDGTHNTQDVTIVGTTVDTTFWDPSRMHQVPPADNWHIDRYVYPDTKDEEIKALRKEIRELKDMISEHMLLGHGKDDTV